MSTEGQDSRWNNNEYIKKPSHAQRDMQRLWLQGGTAAPLESELRLRPDSPPAVVFVILSVLPPILLFHNPPSVIGLLDCFIADGGTIDCSFVDWVLLIGWFVGEANIR